MSRFILLGLLMSTTILTYVAAEAPFPVTNMAYATVDEKSLYVEMGLTSNGSYSTNQFFLLDLTVPWSSDNPSWKNMVSSMAMPQAPSDFGPSMTVSADKQSLIIWGGYNSQISTYDIGNGVWAPSKVSPTNLTPLRQGLKAVTDPSSGLVYVPSGVDQGKSMAAYDPKSDVTKSLPMPSELSGNGLGYYGAVWSTEKNSVLVYGGHLLTAISSANTQLFGFNPSTASWTAYNTTGPSPGAVDKHCLVSAYGGPKLIAFGGLNSLDSTLSGLYILDVATMTWTKGGDIDPSHGRTNMACTVSGDNFVAWGGDQFGDIPQSFSAPIVYNLKDNKWTTQFVPSGAGSTGSIVNSSTFPVASAVGAIVGSLVLVALAGFLVYRRSRKNKVYIQDIESTVSVDTKSSTKKRQPKKSLTINVDLKIPIDEPAPEKDADADANSDSSSEKGLKRSSSRRSNFKLSGDLEYLAQLSQLEMQMDHELENEKPSNRRLSQIRHPRTASVVSSLSQNSLTSFKYESKAEVDESDLSGK